jgi:hypothetical protein
MIDPDHVALETELVLLGKLLLFIKYETTMNSLGPVKPVSRISKFRVWVLSVRTVIFMKIPVLTQ